MSDVQTDKTSADYYFDSYAHFGDLPLCPPSTIEHCLDKEEAELIMEGFGIGIARCRHPAGSSS